jgi:fructose-1,6-bisphosphatase/inositol monophosphatase family enzyme
MRVQETHAVPLRHAEPEPGTIPDLLRALHRELRDRLARLAGAGEMPPAARARNPKGDEQKPFDVLAHGWVRDWLAARFAAGVIVSEETLTEERFGTASPAFRFVVDPVDGSDNHERDLPLSALSVAVLPADAPLAVGSVEYAVVGGLRDDECLVATRAGGAHDGAGNRLSTSSVRRIEQSFVSCELNHWAPDGRSATLLARCRAVRSYGCASRALALVARGALDAHIDVRGRLTPESLLAASLLVLEAGGHVCTASGEPLGEFESLRQRTTLVAAATQELAEEIVHALAI